MSNEIHPQEARRRILELVEADVDEDVSIKVILRVGSNDASVYYLVIHTKEYEELAYLNERYICLSREPDDEFDATWMKNGINRRVGHAETSDDDIEAVAEELSAAYQFVADNADTKTSAGYIDAEVTHDADAV